MGRTCAEGDWDVASATVATAISRALRMRSIYFGPDGVPARWPAGLIASMLGRMKRTLSGLVLSLIVVSAAAAQTTAAPAPAQPPKTIVDLVRDAIAENDFRKA